jgi:D-alanyl-D-alanine carboxypeptidase
MATTTFSRTTSRVVTTTLVTALTALGLAMPAVAVPGAVAAKPAKDTLQSQVNAIYATGSVGVLARSTGPRERRGHGRAL